MIIFDHCCPLYPPSCAVSSIRFRNLFQQLWRRLRWRRLSTLLIGMLATLMSEKEDAHEPGLSEALGRTVRDGRSLFPWLGR